MVSQRQHCIPLILPVGSGRAEPLKPLGLGAGLDAVSEADIQALVHAHPNCLPISEIDSIFSGPVSICRELVTSAGSIDNLLVTPSGLPILVECKLWRNPEARREVVGQILDYAKELTRWSSSDLQREVSRNLKREGNVLLDLVREATPDVDESQFNDALTANLRRGRFLLLIVGDGIREGVEAIADYLQVHMGLHFSLGLVEMPIFTLPSGDRLVVPRVLARANIMTRTVIEVPAGYVLQADSDSEVASESDPARSETQQFWSEFLAILKLDDPEQPIPRPARVGYLNFMLPATNGSSWIGVFRNWDRGEVGLHLGSHRNSSGDYARQAVVEDWDAIRGQIGGDAEIVQDSVGRDSVREARVFGNLGKHQVRKEAFVWLAERVNSFVNILRPRVRAAVADQQVQT